MAGYVMWLLLTLGMGVSGMLEGKGEDARRTRMVKRGYPAGLRRR